MNTRSIPEGSTLCALQKYTFTDDAAHFLAEQYPGITVENYNRIKEAAAQTRHGKHAIVPVENSSSREHVFVARHYLIIADPALSVVASVQMRVHMCLAGKDTSVTPTDVYSHPQALSQCSKVLAKYPDIIRHETDSTAQGAEFVAKNGSNSAVALCSKRAVEAYGLKIYQEGVSDTAFNATEMYVMHQNGGKAGIDPYAHYHSIELHPENKPGSLLQGLDALADNCIDLVSLHSIRTLNGTTAILIEAEKRGNPNQLRDAWKNLATLAPLAFGSWNERLLSDPNANTATVRQEKNISIQGLQNRTDKPILNIVPLNRRGILRDILKILSDAGINIQDLHSYAIAPRQYGFTMSLEGGNAFKAHDNLANLGDLQLIEWKKENC